MRLLIDKLFYLMGDEDGGVGVDCRVCSNRNGLPIIYYTTDPNDVTYKETADVVRVTTISEMMTAGTLHATRHRADNTIPEK